MRFTIKYKLFLTLLLATFAVVAAMLFFVKISFERGFLEYVNRVEQEVHDNLVETLASAYQQNGNWDFIQANPRMLKDLHRQSMIETQMSRNDVDEALLPPPGPRGERPPRPRGHRKSHHRFGPPRKRGVCLLDQDQQALTPCRRPEGEMQLREIQVDGKSIGYLASLPRKKLSDEHDLHFSEQHQQFLLLLGLAIALISIIVAFPISRLLVKPIKELAEATRKLAAGDYQARISVNASDELGDLSRDFNSLARTLEGNEIARQQWIADISHELRTPLSVLRGEIEALQDGVREVSEDRLASLHQQVMNLNRLVNDLYELSMSDIGALNYEKDHIDIIAVLSASIDSMRGEFEQKQIELSFQHDEATMELFADTERLRQLFSNLMTNSLRYTDAGGSLKVTANKYDKNIVITMEDSAPGVSSDDLPRLFERLYRVDSSRNRASGGTGLGLAICKNIVDAHEGVLSAESSSMGGLKLTMNFPGA